MFLQISETRTYNNKRKRTIQLQSESGKRVKIQLWQPMDSIIYPESKLIS